MVLSKLPSTRRIQLELDFSLWFKLKDTWEENIGICMSSLSISSNHNIMKITEFWNARLQVKSIQKNEDDNLVISFPDSKMQKIQDN